MILWYDIRSDEPRGREMTGNPTQAKAGKAGALFCVVWQIVP